MDSHCLDSLHSDEWHKVQGLHKEQNLATFTGVGCTVHMAKEVDGCPGYGDWVMMLAMG